MEQFRGGLLDAIDFVSKQNENSDKHEEIIDLTEDENTMGSLQISDVRKRHFPSYGGIYSCKYCKQNRSTQRAIMQHVNEVHLKIKPYSCKQCTHRSARENDLLDHVNRKHLKLKPFKCNKCSFASHTKRFLRHHGKTVHQMELKSYSCNHCKCSSAREKDLAKHVKATHSLQPFKCNKCNNYDRNRHLKLMMKQ